MAAGVAALALQALVSTIPDGNTGVLPTSLCNSIREHIPALNKSSKKDARKLLREEIERL
jgi:ribosome recycling factor